MDELRFVRRDDRSLIVANDAGDEFRFVVDEAALSELRHLARREREPGKAGPREIQALIRAGKSRAEVASETGLDDADIERYEEPVLAERRYILERAHAVPVRTEAHDDSDQRFGAVIAERLAALGSETSEWAAWRDEERGWMVSLEFTSHDVGHRAVWTFEHRKGMLSPINPDAVNLSKQGDVGERLIPKLRAVDSSDRSGRFDSGAFDTDALPLNAVDEGQASPEATRDEESAEAEQHPLTDPNAEFARRREIDQRAISSDADAPADLSQTADLLDALRKRRGERDQGKRQGGASASLEPQELDLAALSAADDDTGSGSRSAEDASPHESPRPALPTEAPAERPAAPRSIWSSAGVTGTPAPAPSAVPERSEPAPEASDSVERTPKKGRASIPSWDDILFGTRSDEDPAN
ncbi:septation protein SepH [Leucobacter sp. USCH14]|uniref:septation protein SepH n=1 Tax=Leucobacter sp. USCH14 TaxID=3024838 RepID=UPI0030B0E215